MELAGDPRMSSCPRVDLLLAAFSLLVGLALTPLLCSSLLTTLSPLTYITCQIHSVITGLIKMLPSKGTGSPWGCGICMKDTHLRVCAPTPTQSLWHSARVLCLVTSGDQQTNDHLQWWMDGFSPQQTLFLFVKVLYNNTQATFVMWNITYALLSEFAQKHDHLAHADDLHLHRFSWSDNYLVRSSKLPTLIVV